MKLFCDQCGQEGPVLGPDGPEPCLACTGTNFVPGAITKPRWTAVQEAEDTFLTFERGRYRLRINRYGQPKAALTRDGLRWQDESNTSGSNWDDETRTSRAIAWAEERITEAPDMRDHTDEVAGLLVVLKQIAELIPNSERRVAGIAGLSVVPDQE